MPLSQGRHEEVVVGRERIILFFEWQGSRAGGWSGVAGQPQQQLLLPETFSCLPLLAYVLPFAIRAAAVRAVEKRKKNDTLPPPPKGQVHNVNVCRCYVVIRLVFSFVMNHIEGRSSHQPGAVTM